MLKLVYVNLIVSFFSYQSEVSIVPEAAPDMPLLFPLHITDSPAYRTTSSSKSKPSFAASTRAPATTEPRKMKAHIAREALGLVMAPLGVDCVR